MKKPAELFNTFNTPVSARNFALYRIILGLYLLLMVLQLNEYRPLLFEQVAGIGKSIFPAKLFLLCWAISAFMLMIGAFTRLFSVMNYLMVVLATTFFSITNIGSFNDDILRITSFLLIFMPASRHFSVDAVFRRTFISDTPAAPTTRFNYVITIFLSLGLLYFASGLTKLYSPIWLKGLGFWIPAVVPFKRWNDLPFFTDQKWLMKAANYLTMAWELAFIFVFTRPRWQRIFIPMGIFFHLATALVFPFPFLCMMPIGCYVFFIPDRFWKWLATCVRSKKQLLIRYDPASFLQLKAIAFLKALDFGSRFQTREQAGTTFTMEASGKQGLKAFTEALGTYLFYKPMAWLLLVFGNATMNLVELGFNRNPITTSRPLLNYRFKQGSLLLFTAALTMVQLFIQVYHFYSARTATPQSQRAYRINRSSGYDLSLKPVNLARTFFGINGRGVFLDNSNTGTKAVYAITYEKNGQITYLPLFDAKGHCLEMNRNLLWSKMTFYYIAMRNDPPDPAGLEKFTKFWADKKHVRLDSLDLHVYRRSYEMPAVFEKGCQERLENQPWLPEGRIYWRSGGFRYESLRNDSLQ